MAALDETGLAANTHLIYTSDHGDNVGARGLWGKSTLYEESVKVPMILTGPDVRPCVCETPVDLIDLFPTILQGVGIDPSPEMADRPGRSLFELADAPTEPERPILSEYHAAGSNTAGFMLRKGRWKYHYYVRHRPELFDLQADPEESCDLAENPASAATLRAMHAALLEICDPEAMDRLAKDDQRAMIERFGGVEAASKLGAPAAARRRAENDVMNERLASDRPRRPNILLITSDQHRYDCCWLRGPQDSHPFLDGLAAGALLPRCGDHTERAVPTGARPSSPGCCR
ncbi:MAG: sulfatase-like hydrolase/transferase [Burkholderiaceae bacterium]